jgi:hypothetical protein
MGYRRSLLAIGDKPTSDEDEIQRRFSEVIERREVLVRPPEIYFNRRRTSLYSSSVAPGDPPISKFLSDIEVGVTGFSDSVFLESSLGRRPDNPIIPLHTVVAASILQLFMNLKHGSPIRGGIDIGFGLRQGGHLYSAATVRAVELEKSAEYPRVLVGSSFVRTLGSLAATGETEESRLARTVLSALYRDPDDGRIGLDFMGDVSRRLYAPGIEPGEIKEIWLFAQKSRTEFSVSGLQKEWSYYNRLIKYMESRLGLWGVSTAV